MADFAAQPLDYGALIGQAQGVVSNPLANESALVQIQNQRLAGQQVQQQMAMQRLALQRQQAFGQDLGTYIQNPTAEGLAGLFGKYPEFDKNAEDARAALDRGDITELGSAAALAAKGQYDDAAQIIQQRVDGEKAAGRDSSQAQEVLSLLKSGDPQKQKAAVGALALGVGIAVGPDKAADFLKANGLSSEPVAVGLDQRLVNPSTGEQMIGAQPKMENVTNPVTGESTGFNPYTGTYGAAAAGAAGTPAAGAPAPGSSAPAPGAPASAPAGPSQSISNVLSNEGGYNPKDMNGSPTNFGINFKANAPLLAKMGITAANFKSMTQDQAAQIYATKYWPQSGAADLPANLQAPYFDVYVRNPSLAKKALAQSGGDPAKFMQLASSYFANLAAKNPNAAVYAKAWANRDAKNTQIAIGGAPASAATVPAASDPYHFGGTGVNTKEAPPGYAWNADHTAVMPLAGSDEDPKSYNPQEVDDLARNWIVTGQPLGGQSGGGGGGGAGGTQTVGLRKAAMARATQLMQTLGITADQLPAIRSRYAADKASLTNITQIASGLGASEPALRGYMAQVLATQKKLVDEGVIGGNPVFNTMRLETYSKVGSQQTQQDIRQYRDAINALQTEYAKFMSSAAGMSNTPTTDSARGLASELTEESTPYQAMQGHMAQLSKEAQIKLNAVQAQQQALTAKLGSYLQPHSASAAPSGVVRIHTADQYKSLPSGTHYVDPNGVYRIKP